MWTNKSKKDVNVDNCIDILYFIIYLIYTKIFIIFSRRLKWQVIL